MIHDLLTKLKKPSVLAEGFLFFILLSFFSCASNQQVFQQGDSDFFIPNEIVWQPVENTDYAEYFFYENKNYPLRYHCMKINLANKNLSIVTFPGSESDFIHQNGAKTNYFKGMTAKSFSKKYKSSITINVTPFEGKKNLPGKSALLFSKREITGIHVANRRRLSAPVEKYGAVCFKKNDSGWTGKIFKNQKNQDFTEYDFAFGGFFQILTDSKKESFKTRSNDSRTAVGLSKDGQILYILVVEGEKQSNSIGLSYQECADIFLFLGATDAIQLDGGGSTSLFINGKNSLTYHSLRKNAVFLGFY